MCEWTDIAAFFELVLYNIRKLMAKFTDSRTVWRSLGAYNAGELDVETEMKVVGEVVVI